MRKLRVLDLFSGIGGFSIGLERTGGFQTMLFVEQDNHCQKVLRKRFPFIPMHDDVRTLDFSALKTYSRWSADVITAGFPCQDISPSGPKKGLDGERSGLWWEVARIAAEVGPRVIILENSANLVTGEDGRWLGTILGTLANLGYDAEWHTLSAAMAGAPHRRDRTFIIAYTPGFGQSGQGPLLKSINPAPDAYREASGLVDAVQRNALPFVCGGHDGVPAKLAALELHALGNSVVPQIVEQIGYAILAAMQQQEAA